MKLTHGDIAPDFKIQDIDSNPIDFSNYKDRKVVLSFFRGASCPFCNLRVQELIRNMSSLQEKKVDILTFFHASSGEIKKYAGKQKPPFSIIPDPDLKVYKKYGVESSIFGMLRAMMKLRSMAKIMVSPYFNLRSIKDKPLIPADFLISKNNLVHVSYYGKGFGDHIEIEKILKWAEDQ